jgi:hypothetical protein
MNTQVQVLSRNLLKSGRGANCNDLIIDVQAFRDE